MRADGSTSRTKWVINSIVLEYTAWLRRLDFRFKISNKSSAFKMNISFSRTVWTIDLLGASCVRCDFEPLLTFSVG